MSKELLNEVFGEEMEQEAPKKEEKKASSVKTTKNVVKEMKDKAKKEQEEKLKKEKSSKKEEKKAKIEKKEEKSKSKKATVKKEEKKAKVKKEPKVIDESKPVEKKVEKKEKVEKKVKLDKKSKIIDFPGTLDNEFPLSAISASQEFQDRISPYQHLAQLNPNWENLDKKDLKTFLSEHASLKEMMSKWDERIQALADDIKAIGQIEPIKLWKDDATDSYQILSGFSRYEAHLLLKRKTIKATIYSGIDYVTAKAIAVQSNMSRTELSYYEKCRSLHLYSQRHAVSKQKLGEIYSMTEGHVGQIQNVFKWLEEVEPTGTHPIWEALETTHVNFRSMFELRKIHQKFDKVLLDEAAKEGWNYNHCQKVIKQLTQERNAQASKTNTESLKKDFQNDFKESGDLELKIDETEFEEEAPKKSSDSEEMGFGDESEEFSEESELEPSDIVKKVIKHLQSAGQLLGKVSFDKKQVKKIKAHASDLGKIIKEL